ncbi:MAG: aminotransferase class I/II-fold pyridoxal phosphate-dependent enzyme [candidate division FCPU426 bacterium]
MVQRHGADNFSKDGRPSGLLDFSHTVVEVPPPAGWEKKLAASMPSLRRYPQPYAVGLASFIEKRLRLPAGSVLVGNGLSECLSWIAQSLRGKPVVLETPCFGEYAVWLSRHGALTREVGADEPWSPEWPRLQKALKGAASLWLADPANPSGLLLSSDELRERAEFCSKQGILLVLDEALRAQALKDPGDRSIALAVKKPGMLVLRSLGKGLGLPGLRLGFVVGHPREIAKLGQYTDPWNVGSLAQAMGPWILDQEIRGSRSRRRVLASWKKDLLARMKEGLPSGCLAPRPSDTGFFLARLMGRRDDSRTLVLEMAARGILLRSCASYGGWGLGYLRLNVRAPGDNQRLVATLGKLYAKT